MRKLMWFTIGFALAVALGVYILETEALLMAAAVSAVLVAVFLVLLPRWKNSRLGAMMLFGCMLGALWQFGYEAVYLAPVRAVDSSNCQMEIVATDYSTETYYGASVQGWACIEGKYYQIKTYLPDGVSMAPGDRIQGVFTLKATLPGCSRDSDYYRSNGVFLIATPILVTPVENAVVLPWYGYPALVRETVKAQLDGALSEDAAAFARALLLGDTENLDYETDTAFKISGIRHIIAVSGLHISILFSLIFLLTGKRKRLASVIGMFVLLFFAAVAGFSPSITRACIMHGLMSIAFLTKREYDAPTALSFAVLVMLVQDPWTMSHVGFQLSVGCVAGILLFSEKIQSWLLDRKRLGRYKGLRGRLARWFSSSVAVSVSATLLTTPLSALYFGVVSLVGVLTNLVTLWIISFVFYGLVLVCALSFVWLPLAKGVGWIVWVAIKFVVLTAKTFAAFPFAAVYIHNIYTLLWLIISYGLLVALLCMRRKRPLLLGLCSGVVLCLALLLSWMRPLMDECRVTVLDVGQGQCILLQSRGKNYLVDCGGDSATSAADEAAALLLSQGISRLDGLILTHFDRDHAEGVQYLLTRVSAKQLYLPECLDTDGLGQALKENADSRVQIVDQALTLTFGSSQLSLYPSQLGMTDNESGLCVLFQTENCDILITGDRGFSGEEELLRQVQLPQLELLIVGHHGSRYSTGTALLEATRPEVAIISVSGDNRYGHPSQEILDRLAQYGCEIYRTDQDGTVVFRR